MRRLVEIGNVSKAMKAVVNAHNSVVEHVQHLEARIIALEKSKIPPPKDPLAGLKALSAQMEATEHLYAPLRSDTASLVKLEHLARRMLDPHDLGHAVTFEVRELAREALGKEKIG